MFPPDFPPQWGSGGRNVEVVTRRSKCTRRSLLAIVEGEMLSVFRFCGFGLCLLPFCAVFFLRVQFSGASF